MDMENTCHYIPYDRHDETIHTLYFVLEKNYDSLPQNQTLAFYKMCIVTAGKGKLKLRESAYPIQKGDIFFVFPGVEHSILTEEAPDSLQCIYISFIGIRANQIMTRYHITPGSPVYKGYEELIGFWEQALALAQKNTVEILSEGVLLYTFAVLGREGEEEALPENRNLFHNIKKYMDENYHDPALSLNSVSEMYHYNPKYISTAFKSYFKVGFNEYLNAIRLHEAKNLIQNNMTSVKDIAAKCGFRDQYYFSRAFKKHTGKSPREYMAELSEGK